MLRRLHEGRRVVHVGPAASQQQPRPGVARRPADAVVVGRVGVDVLVVDDGRGPAAQVFDQADHRRQVGLLLGQRLGHRPDGRRQPVEQRLVVGQAADEGLEEVGVGVDHAGHDGHVAGVEDRAGPGAHLVRRLPGAQRGDALAFDEQVAGVEHALAVVHGDDRAVFDEDGI